MSLCTQSFHFAEGTVRPKGAAMLAALRHIDCWIFDLDNSLYPASANLFELIDIRMGDYIQRLLACDPVEARRVQKGYFHDHGTTLAGLMAAPGVRSERRRVGKGWVSKCRYRWSPYH